MSLSVRIVRDMCDACKGVVIAGELGISTHPLGNELSL